MSKFYCALFPLLYLLTRMTVFGVGHQYHVIPPEYVKHSKHSHNAAIQDKAPPSRATLYPKIHSSVWSYFCPAHLTEDPKGCSSWYEDNSGLIQLEFIASGSATAYYDPELIRELSYRIDLIPKTTKESCGHAWCKTCKQTVLQSLSYNEGEEYDEEGEVETTFSYFPVYKCACTGEWWLDLNDLVGEECGIYDNWKFCNAPAIYPGYVDWHEKAYFPLFKHYLSYIEENPSCDCYWPQIQTEAKEISDCVYTLLKEELQDSHVDETREMFHPTLRDRTQHGFLSGLLTHAFFYSDYHTILTDFDRYFKEWCWDESSNNYVSLHQNLLGIESEIQSSFLSIYNHCLKKHPHPKIYYERGMVLFHSGENLDALEDIRTFISYAEKNDYQDLLTSDLYFSEGRLLSESLSYDEAIVALTKAIAKDPENKEAYIERAISYFETGNFKKALADYLASGFRPKEVDPDRIGKVNAVTFGQGIALGMIKGGRDSTTEFVPSLLSSLRGLSRGLWGFVSDPLTVSQDMIDCASACLEFIKKTSNQKRIGALVPELQECLHKWNSLNDSTKGETIGYVIGKYGVDIFIGSGSLKAIQLYRNLRKANALMTLETAITSPTHAKIVLARSINEQKQRQEVFKNGVLKIQWDKQGKHIPEHKNYIPEKNKSILSYKNPQQLIDIYAGKGKKFGNEFPGMPGYKEDINFHELIGYAVDEITGTKMPTSWGRIHYAKDGVHIVPIKPRG